MLELAGDLDVSSADDAERELLRLEDGAPPHLVIDLRQVTFLDSTGLRLIVAADSRARRSGRRMSVVHGPESVRRVFRITLLEWRLDFVDDPAQAIGLEDDGS